MRSTLISLATCLLISSAVVAQDTPAQPKVIPPGVVRVEGDVRTVFQVLTSRRARLGISVNLRARDTDSKRTMRLNVRHRFRRESIVGQGEVRLTART